jgi:hypothetical protein
MRGVRGIGNRGGRGANRGYDLEEKSNDKVLEEVISEEEVN